MPRPRPTEHRSSEPADSRKRERYADLMLRKQVVSHGWSMTHTRRPKETCGTARFKLANIQRVVWQAGTCSPEKKRSTRYVAMLCEKPIPRLVMVKRKKEMIITGRRPNICKRIGTGEMSAWSRQEGGVARRSSTNLAERSSHKGREGECDQIQRRAGDDDLSGRAELASDQEATTERAEI
jgi:hypothetical protein